MNWVTDLEDRIRTTSLSKEQEELWERQSIYTVPPYMADLNSKAYNPKMVSIGPYHHGKSHLKPMEAHKRRALHRFLIRSGKPLTDYAAALEEVVQQLMDAYEQLDEMWHDQGRFLQLMILDGCFLLEILRAFSGECSSSSGYARNDPIFSSHAKLNAVAYMRRDVLLVENQLPLLVLEKLLSVENGKTKEENGEFIKALVLKASTLDRPLPKVGRCLHVLDIYRKGKICAPSKACCMVEIVSLRKRSSYRAGKLPVSRSATELHDAGVKFRKSATYNFKDITFDNGVLSLPIFIVRDTTESIYLNLIAFEQLHPNAGCEVRSYFFFMACLLNSAKDVRLLQSEKIIQSTVASDEAVVKLFHQLAKDIMIIEPDCRMYAMIQNLDGYYMNNMMRWTKRLRHWRLHLLQTYFKNPWTFFSLVGATILLGLTFAQTYFTAVSFYKSNGTVR